MHSKRPRWLISLFILPALACSTFNRLAEGGNLTDLATPPANDSLGPVEPGQQTQDEDTLILPSGLTIGSPRESRIALSEEILDVLEARARETYTPEELNTVGNTLTYTLPATAEDRLLWVYGWCATTPELLEGNLEQMKIEFVAEDNIVPLSQFYSFDDVQTAGDGTELPCRTYVAIVSNWPGGLNTLETRITFLEKINDGMGDFDAGKIVFKYEVLGQ